jgi:ABC-type nickel/cobalt efflux system permease component RcnA
LVTLFASKYVLPERLFPIISLISGVIVLFLGLNLFFKRLAIALGGSAPDPHQHDHADAEHHHQGPHSHDHEHHQAQAQVPAHAMTHDPAQAHHGLRHHSHDHLHQHHSHDHVHESTESEGDSFTHTHDGHTHSHLPPGTDDAPITWRSLLALGISGGLLPCPSALVVLLTAISIGRIGYGLVLVLAFSLGLAATLTAVGLVFLYAGRLLKRPTRHSKLIYVLPVISALVIACLGAVICYQALVSNGFTL